MSRQLSSTTAQGAELLHLTIFGKPFLSLQTHFVQTLFACTQLRFYKHQTTGCEGRIGVSDAGGVCTALRHTAVLPHTLPPHPKTSPSGEVSTSLSWEKANLLAKQVRIPTSLWILPGRRSCCRLRCSGGTGAVRHGQDPVTRRLQLITFWARINHTQSKMGTFLIHSFTHPCFPGGCSPRRPPYCIHLGDEGIQPSIPFTKTVPTDVTISGFLPSFSKFHTAQLCGQSSSRSPWMKQERFSWLSALLEAQ